MELAAEAKLYEAQKQADGVRVTAEAQAYAIEVEAKANTEQTRVIAAAIADNGQPAINFEIVKRQVEALGLVAAAENSKTIIVPTDVTGVMGSLEVLLKQFRSES